MLCLHEMCDLRDGQVGDPVAIQIIDSLALDPYVGHFRRDVWSIGLAIRSVVVGWNGKIWRKRVYTRTSNGFDCCLPGASETLRGLEASSLFMASRVGLVALLLCTGSPIQTLPALVAAP